MSMPAATPLHFAVLAVDVVLFAFIEGGLRVLLIPVHLEPYFTHGCGLPGGLIRPKETAEEAIHRIVCDKTGVEITSRVWLEQLQAFTRVDRDPRGRVVSLAYIGVLPPELFAPSVLRGGAQWVSYERVKKLAYDHEEILRVAHRRLCSKMAYTPIVRWLLPKTFTLSDLQSCYEQLLGAMLDRRNFRKRLLSLDLIEETGTFARGQHRPAMTYRFKKKLPEVVAMMT